MRKRKHNRISGFSLIEVMVGIALLGLVTVPVCASLILSVRLNSHTQNLMEAQLQAAGVMETLLAEGVDLSDWGTPEDGWYTAEIDGVQVEVKADPTNYYKTVVTAAVNGEEVSFETTVRKGGDTE